VSHKILSWKTEGRNPLGNLGHRVDGKTSLKLTFKVRCEGLGPSEHGNGPSVQNNLSSLTHQLFNSLNYLTNNSVIFSILL
jgi:hypothetical protein